jgi:hypothetical protein
MPWSAKDAKSKTKKARTPAQKKRWATTANSVLKKTGNDATAIKVANARMRKK